MTDDQGKSQLFGEGLPGTGGDFIDEADTEGHSRGGPGGHLPSADGTEPDGFNRTTPFNERAAGDEDTEGHSRGGPGGHIPGIGGGGGRTSIPGIGGGGGRTSIPGVDDAEDTEGHSRGGPGGHIPGIGGGGGRTSIPGIGGGGGRTSIPGIGGGGGRTSIPGVDDAEDTEGHLYTGGPTTQGEFAKRAPGDNPHGER